MFYATERKMLCSTFSINVLFPYLFFSPLEDIQTNHRSAEKTVGLWIMQAKTLKMRRIFTNKISVQKICLSHTHFVT